MNLLYTHCADNHPHDSPVSLCFSDFDVMTHKPLTEERRIEQEAYWKGWTSARCREAQRQKGRDFAEHFKHPKYRRVNGRPVIYRGNADSLLFYARFDITPREVLSLISEGAGEEIYFVATNTPTSYYRQLGSWGISAFTEYLSFSKSWNDVMALYRVKWAEGIAIARATGLKYWIPVTTGFDSRAWYEHPSLFIPTKAQFEQHVKEANEVAAKNFDATDGNVCYEALNEIGEGSAFLPFAPNQLHNGREMLDAMIRATA